MLDVGHDATRRYWLGIVGPLAVSPLGLLVTGWKGVAAICLAYIVGYADPWDIQGRRRRV